MAARGPRDRPDKNHAATPLRMTKLQAEPYLTSAATPDAKLSGLDAAGTSVHRGPAGQQPLLELRSERAEAAG